VHSYADVKLDRGTALGYTGVILGLIALVLFAELNPAARVQARLFPPGRPVPISVLLPGGMLDFGYPMSAAASTSFDDLRQTVLGGQPCHLPDPHACWAQARVPAGMLLVAALPGDCNNREWYGWVSGSTLGIDVVTWRCVRLGGIDTGAGMMAQGSYFLLGVPLSRLPHGRLLVKLVYSGGPPIPVTLP